MIFLCISSILGFSYLNIDSTIFWWTLKSFMFLSMVVLWDKSFRPTPILIWMALILVSGFAGTTFCRDYWDWKQLVSNVLDFSICVAALMAYSPDILQIALNYLYKHFWKLFIVLVLFLMSDGIGKFMLPFSFLALFYPLLDAKYRRFVWIALLITIFLGYDGRSEILKFLFCITVGLFSLRHDIEKYSRRWYWLFYVLPFILFMLAVNGTFNIFKIGEELNLNNDETSRINATDTRTLLYEDVIATTLERNSILWGGTLARGYHSDWMIVMDDQTDIIGDVHYGERSKTESSMLNVFMYFGIIGVIIYLVLFGSASYLAIFKANNTYIPVIGLTVAFRFMMGWIEDFTNFDLNMFFLWSMIGICYSPRFREMTDEQFCEWLEGVLA